MDIIFRFGTHYYEGGIIPIWLQIIIEFIGAFFGFGFALLLYYLQTKKDKKKKIISDIQEKKNKLEYYNLLIENIIGILETQIKIISDFIPLQKHQPDKLQTLKRIATNDFKRLHSIDSRGIFEAFTTFYGNNIEWIKLYREFNSELDYLEILSNEINKLYELNYDSFYNKLNGIKGLIEFIQDGLSTLAFGKANKYGISRWDSDDYVLIDKYIKLYMELVDNKSTIFELESKFVEPLLSEIMEEGGKYHFSEEFSTYCHTVRTRINEFRNDMDDYLNGLEGSLKSIETHLEKIKILNEDLKKRALTSVA